MWTAERPPALAACRRRRRCLPPLLCRPARSCACLQLIGNSSLMRVSPILPAAAASSMSSSHHEDAQAMAATEQAMQIAFLQDFYQVGGWVGAASHSFRSRWWVLVAFLQDVYLPCAWLGCRCTWLTAACAVGRVCRLTLFRDCRLLLALAPGCNPLPACKRCSLRSVLRLRLASPKHPMHLLPVYLQTVRDKCFDKCVTKPSSSLSSSEQQCLARCCDRCAGERWGM